MRHSSQINCGRFVAGAAGLALLAPVLAVSVLALPAPLTTTGLVYLLAAALAAGGLVGALPWGRPALLVSAAGVALALGVAGWRLAEAGRGAGPMSVVVLPEGQGTRWANVLVDEQDLLLVGEGLMRAVGGVSRREHAGLAPALAAGYTELRAANQVVASPVPSTYLFWQGPRAFDAVVVEPAGAAEPAAALVFLHGFAGNVSLQCWQIARAAPDRLTVCPSTGWVGDWWRPGGAATLQATLDYVRGRGVERMDVGGFSNGGIGLSRLAGEVAAEDGVEGLFFIAGVTNPEAIRATGLPVLILQGAGDERMRPGPARAAAAVIGDAARYVELEADHFLIVKEAAAVQAALGGWLGDLAQIEGR